MKKILLTGAGPRSFIGRSLKEALAGRYLIFAPDHAQLELTDSDAVARYTEQNGIEAVVHAAGRPIRDDDGKEYDNDMDMFDAVTRLAGRVERVLYFGSGAEYDKSRDIVMAREEDIAAAPPSDAYGRAKHEMNAVARQSHNIYNLRLFGVFGPYERWDARLPSNLCYKAILGLPLTIRRDCMFDYLYIDDLTRAVEWFLENDPKHHDYNVCGGTPCRLTELAATVREISGKALNITLLSEQPGRDYTGSNARLLAEAPSLVPMPMKEALEKLYRYCEAHVDLIDQDVLAASR